MIWIYIPPAENKSHSILQEIIFNGLDSSSDEDDYVENTTAQRRKVESCGTPSALCFPHSLDLISYFIFSHRNAFVSIRVLARSPMAAEVTPAAASRAGGFTTQSTGPHATNAGQMHKHPPAWAGPVWPDAGRTMLDWPIRDQHDDTANRSNLPRSNARVLVRVSERVPSSPGQSLEDARQTGEWVCPKCQGNCNCSFCRRKSGLVPTGPLVYIAREKGYAGVSEYL
ncbi:LOW QUALITY PROTEIN: zinc-finger domain of monoamine-oxidase A repressor R1-domain-containing protein, partial [Jimgerdemannia flammicorona]